MVTGCGLRNLVSTACECQWPLLTAYTLCSYSYRRVVDAENNFCGHRIRPFGLVPKELPKWRPFYRDAFPSNVQALWRMLYGSLHALAQRPPEWYKHLCRGLRVSY